MNRQWWLWPFIGIVFSGFFLAWLLSIGYWPDQNGMDINGSQIGRDFINDWAAPQLALHGHLAELSHANHYTKLVGDLFGQKIPTINWSYPPPLLLVVYPLSLLPYFAALALWTGVGLILAIIALRVWCPDKPWALLGFLLSPACIINVLSGQNGFFTAFLLMAGLLAVRRKPVLAGIAIGLLTLKPHLGLLLPLVLIAMKAWRTIAAATITALVLFGLSLAVFGIAIWKPYLGHMTAVQMSYLWWFHGLYATMIHSPFGGFRVMGADYSMAIGMQMLVSCFVVIHALVSLARVKDRRQHAFIVLSAIPLLTPYIFNYDMVAMAIPLTCLLWSDSGSSAWRRSVYLTAWLAPTGAMLAGIYCPPLEAIAPVAYMAVFLLACHPEKDGNISDSALESHNMA